MFVSHLVGELPDPVQDLQAHRSRLREAEQSLRYAEAIGDEKKADRLRADIQWRVREIAQMERLAQETPSVYHEAI